MTTKTQETEKRSIIIPVVGALLLLFMLVALVLSGLGLVIAKNWTTAIAPATEEAPTVEPAPEPTVQDLEAKIDALRFETISMWSLLHTALAPSLPPEVRGQGVSPGDVVRAVNARAEQQAAARQAKAEAAKAVATETEELTP